ncbi:uncharacterized protein LOC132787815 [Drosophila nasuta]|uniref:uncharacterized protein LOC132787815 n=1 Tax=Drosophila nasuta TaxID=42062 RepID=UPI00295EAF6F|nr:uncharacterized protein LOC132787815 [Drosophila nasuta]
MRQLLTFSFLLPVLVVSWSLSIPELVQQMHRQQKLDYLLIVGDSARAQPSFWSELQLPFIVLNNISNVNNELETLHSSNLMSIVFVESPAERLLEFVALNLGLWSTAPLLLILQKELQVDAIFQWCWQHKQLLNALAIYDNFEATGLLYSYSPFPIFQLDERRIDNSTNPILLPRLNDLQGYRLPTLVGGSPPRLIVYRRSDNELFYGGFVGHLMHCFEVKYNCRLEQLLPMNESTLVPAQQLRGAVLSGKVQFALAAIYTEKPSNNYTYPFELLNWCLMMPVPGLVPHSELYSRVLGFHTFLIILSALILTSFLLSVGLRRHGYRVQPDEFLLHENCLRGALGQSFKEVLRAPIFVRGIYLQICVLGFLLTAWYNSYFSAYITSGPREKPFSSFDNILKSHFKIVIWNPEYQQLIRYSEKMQRYEAIFNIEPDFERFLKRRDSFDTQFGYMMPHEKWNIIEQQQQVFTSPLFTFREDLCAFRGIPVAFPIAPNSVFREPLERLIGEVTATGLMAHWRDMAFSEMITAGKLSLVDLSESNEFRAMHLMDLHHILIAGALMMTLAFIVFLLEQLHFYCKTKLGRHLPLA